MAKHIHIHLNSKTKDADAFRVSAGAGVQTREGYPGSGVVTLPDGRRFDYYYEDRSKVFRAGMMKSKTLPGLVELFLRKVK